MSRSGAVVKILHLHDSPRIPGGATAYLRLLATEMGRRGFQSSLYSLEEAGGGITPEEACYRYPWPRSPVRRRLHFHHHHEPLARSLRSWIEDQRPDLIHVQNWGVFRSTVFPVLAEAPCPVVMTVHDFTLLDPNPWGLDRSGLSGPLRSWLDRRSLATARRAVFSAVDRFLCPSAALRDQIPFPVGRARLLRLPIEPADAPPFPSGAIRLLFAGTLYQSKGVDLLIRALALGPGDIRVEIAGQGDQRRALEELAAELGIADRVGFLGQLDAEGMDGAYRRASLVVLPSRVAENSPLVLLEAGARGRPSLASDTGGPPELLEPPERGWCFRSEDPADLARILEQAAASPAELARRGSAMRDWVQRNCDPVAHWDAVEAVYQEITA